jgi:hypothetical protein
MIREASPFSISRKELETALGVAGTFVAREFSDPSPRPVIPGVPQDVFDAIVCRAMPASGLPLDAVID